MSNAANWGRIPQELRARPQWAVASGCTCGVTTSKHAGECTFKAPLGVGSNGLYPAKSTDQSTWVDFDTAARAAYARGLDIGYMLSADDPYCCIDLDVKDAVSHPNEPELHTTDDHWKRFQAIHTQAASYSEFSRSGKGLHIWVRGKIGKGRKRDGVEVYSQERFIICTGNVVSALSIEERQQYLGLLLDAIGGEDNEKIELVELEPVESDEQVIARLLRSEPVVDKFMDLSCGHWEKHNFPSQSEADLAMMSYFTFYSQSNEQCRRLFRQTVLGKREKAVKNNKYVDFTLRVIRGRQAREAVHLAEQAGSLDATELINKLNAVGARSLEKPTPIHVAGLSDDRVGIPPPSVAIALAAPITQAAAKAGDEGIPWPPGMAGALARFVYRAAPRPVKEVSIVAAIGLLAGIVGKAFHLTQSGLNIYMILVARSAVGKEAMHSGISALISEASKRSPAIASFVDFNDFASGPALTKACAANQSFVNVCGEWGHKLKRLADENGRDVAMSSLRMVMTNLYQKSGPSSMVGGITYSNKEANIASVSGVAYSMIGETTPDTFYESLTESMMADGFLSRFNIIHYEGDRPPLNEDQVVVPDKILADALADLAQYCQAMNGRFTPQMVGRTDEAAAMFGAFERECDNHINGTKDESKRQMWNRASLKVMRLAAIISVATNWLQPVIEKEHIDWALVVVRRDIEMMKVKIAAGDVGTGDDSRERKIMALLKEFITKGATSGYKVSEEMQLNAIIPHNMINQRLSRISMFKNHRMGANNSIQQTIKAAIDSGYIMQVDRKTAIEKYSFQGLCYRILSPIMDFNPQRE